MGTRPTDSADRRPVIGVIGGMGPAAGFDLAQKITRLTRATGDSDHVPVVVASFPGDIPDRTRFLLRDEGDNPGTAIAAVARKLESTGVTVAGIPCNTAHAPPILEHAMLQLRQKGSRIRLLNMIDETVAHVRRTAEPGARVGVLSTSGVRRTLLYSRPLSDKGFKVVELDEDSHDRLITDALYSPVYGLKAVSPPEAQARDQVIAALDLLEESGCRIAVLGCTELPLAVPEGTWGGMPLVDPTEILARALIRETYPDRLVADQT